MAARVLVSAQSLPGAYPALPIAANSRDLAFVAGDATNLNYTPLVNDKTVVIAQNTGAGARTVGFVSVADEFGRTGDITAYSMGAGELAIFGAFKTKGWANVGPDVALANPSSAVDDIIDTSAAHGFVSGDAVKFTALTGGAGLVAGTTYYVVATSLASTTFRVAASRGGTAINFTTDITAGTVVKVSDNLWIDVSHAEVKLAVIRPAPPPRPPDRAPHFVQGMRPGGL